MIINHSILTDPTLGRLQNSKTPSSKSPSQIDGPANGLDEKALLSSLGVLVNGTTVGQEGVTNDESQFSQISGQWNAGGSAIQDSSTASASMDFALAGLLNQPGTALLAQGNHQAQTVFQLLQ